MNKNSFFEIVSDIKNRIYPDSIRILDNVNSISNIIEKEKKDFFVSIKRYREDFNKIINDGKNSIENAMSKIDNYFSEKQKKIDKLENTIQEQIEERDSEIKNINNILNQFNNLMDNIGKLYKSLYTLAMNARRYATEDEDKEVIIYDIDENGDTKRIETNEYSAKHWAMKAKKYASSSNNSSAAYQNVKIDDSKTSFTPDFGKYKNFLIEATNDFTINNPSNIQIGSSGFFLIYNKDNKQLRINTDTKLGDKRISTKKETTLIQYYVYSNDIIYVLAF